MRKLAVVLAAALAATSAPAVAAVPVERTVQDAVEPRRGYDIVSVTLRAAPSEDGKARVVVEHGRRVAVGDGIDVWFDTDDDRSPDIYLTGFAFSEFAVFKARGWDGHGRDISDRGCATLTMRGRRSVVRFDPSCLEPSQRFSVGVRSFVQGRPARTADHVPRPERLTKRVLSSQPA